MSRGRNLTQKERVEWSLFARTAHDVNGPLRRHQSETDRLQAELDLYRTAVHWLLTCLYDRDDADTAERPVNAPYEGIQP